MLVVSAQPQRSTLELLDTLPIEVAVTNPARTPALITFSQPSEYAIDVIADGSVLWTSLPPSPPPQTIQRSHTRTFAPGTTTLAVYDWNELLTDRRSPTARAYVVRVRLLSQPQPIEGSIRVRFSAPLSPSAFATLKPNDVFSLAGTLDDRRDVLGDARGSAQLSRRIADAPIGVAVVVRGYVVVRPDGSRTFWVERWAPLGPAASPQP